MNTLIKPPCTNGTAQDKQIDARLAEVTASKPDYTYIMLTYAYEPVAEICKSQDETALLRHMYAYLFEAANLGLSGGDEFITSLVKVPTKYAQAVCFNFATVCAPVGTAGLNGWLQQYNGYVVETHDIPVDDIPALVILSDDGQVFIGAEILTEHSDFYNCPFEEGMSVWSITSHIQSLIKKKDTQLLAAIRSVFKLHSSTGYKVDCLAVSIDAEGIEFNSWFKIEDIQELYDALELDDEILANFFEFRPKRS